MEILITFGPGYEPIDEVRRITNFSTGELGALLVERFVSAGFRVTCLRGVMATHPISPDLGAIAFTTNDDLAARLAEAAAHTEFDAVCHLAALCDYRVKSVESETGEVMTGAKIPSRSGALKLCLEPSRKLITDLRDFFPKALLIGWKYELDGSRAEAIQKGRSRFPPP